MKLFTTDDLARQFIDAYDNINGSYKSDERKHAELAGTARAFRFLFDLVLNGASVVGEDAEKKED